jgi:hypothetical protein
MAAMADPSRTTSFITCSGSPCLTHDNSPGFMSCATVGSGTAM